jgi:ATP-binding cassette subfamily F protein 3
MDDRIGLLGSNGNGKSTLAKLLCGRLDVIDGYRRASKKMIYGYFAQHQLDELNFSRSAYDHIADLMPDATEAQKRARVAAIGFGVDKANTAAGKLSGGEKARLLFALATFHAPHLLILDEPTNHLDIDSREALIHALNDYEGAVVLISHDRHLIEATVDRLWVVRDGKALPYDGDLESYKAECLAAAREERRAAARGAKIAAQVAVPGTKQDARRAAAMSRAELAPLKKRVDMCEREIAKIGKEIAQLDIRLGDTALYERDPGLAQKLVRDRGTLAKALEDAEVLWLEATETYEQARRQQETTDAA